LPFAANPSAPEITVFVKTWPLPRRASIVRVQPPDVSPSTRVVHPRFETWGGTSPGSPAHRGHLCERRAEVPLCSCSCIDLSLKYAASFYLQADGTSREFFAFSNPNNSLVRGPSSLNLKKENTLALTPCRSASEIGAQTWYPTNQAPSDMKGLVDFSVSV